MSQNRTTLILKSAFEGLEVETLNQLRRFAQRKTYPPNTILCHQGEIEHIFYVIVEGRVLASQKLEHGEDRILGMLGPNKYFGEMSLLDDTPRMATCTTVMPTTVLEITEDVFDRMVEKSPALAYSLMQRILANLRELDRVTIDELTEKNKALEKAYQDLKAAQAKLVEQERLERELELAAEMQRSLLPDDLPGFEDYAFAAYLQPARQVGGDFYDVMVLDDEHVAILIADVADKGFHAALFMAMTRTLFWGEAMDSHSPAQVAQAVHRGMLQVATTSDVFVTAFYGVLHRPSGRLRYVRAGHDRPLLYRPGQSVKPLPGNGRFLGMLPELTLPEFTLQLQPGDRLLLYSDGVPDAINRLGKNYGNARLQRILKQGGKQSAKGLVRLIADDVAGWVQKSPAFDDLTLMVVEVRG